MFDNTSVSVIRPRIQRTVVRDGSGCPPVSAPDASLHYLTVFLGLLAATIFTLADADGHRAPRDVMIEILVIAGITTSTVWYLRRHPDAVAQSSILMPVVVLVPLLSLLWEPVQRLFLDTGRPFEMMLMFSLRNLLLILAVFGFRAGFQRLSLVLGVCMAIFCAVISNDPRVHLLIGIFGMSAIGWLIISYWETLRLRLIATERRKTPRLWLAALCSLPLLVLGIASSSQQQLVSAMNGFLPGSGGTGDSDPFSRGGVNDGEGLVAGKDNIKSFGPIEDAPFADDKRPSLYDVVNDQFDEPVRKPQEQDRSVALPPELMAQVRQRMAKSGQASREFSALRKSTPRDNKRIHDIRSKALFYVAGRAPLHLRMELYDIFDGVQWYPTEDTASGTLNGMAMLKLSGRHWLRIPCTSRFHDLFTHTETHAVKITNLTTNVIPSPSDTRGIHIDKVDTADMFSWHKPGMVRMNRRELPELLPIQILSERCDRSQLSHNDDLTWISLGSDNSTQVPQTLHMNSIRTLAAEWTNGIPRGWGQIDTVCRRLQEHYVMDRTAKPPEHCEFPVGDFLLRSRRGPDYLFASSAVMLLRSLGYSARLVSGFYVNPGKYEIRHRHTAVHADDAHFWCEVHAGSGTWITVEPTPGYEVLGPPPGIGQRLLKLLETGMIAAVRHRMAIGVGLLLLIAVLVRRHQLVDIVCTWLWRMFPAADHRRRVLQTIRLLDRRLRYAGLPRPRGMTYSRWIRTEPALQRVAPGLSQFADLANWASFCLPDPEIRMAGNHSVDDSADQQIEGCCRTMSSQVTLALCIQELGHLKRTRSGPYTRNDSGRRVINQGLSRA